MVRELPMLAADFSHLANFQRPLSVQERKESPGQNCNGPKRIISSQSIYQRRSLSSSTITFAGRMLMPYSSTGRRGKLPVRFHCASGRLLRPSGKMNAPGKKTMLPLMGSRMKMQKVIWRMMGRDRRSRMVNRKEARVPMVQLNRLILLKAWELLPRI
jgi:hypothetical protein